jgi:hypothetical protein
MYFTSGSQLHAPNFIECLQHINQGFHDADLEALAAKTASPRTFMTIVAMLMSALRRDVASVSLDILTPHDLEIMRASTFQQQHISATAQQTKAERSDGKRYLVLAYTSDFERVQYPLPLRLAETGAKSRHTSLPKVCRPENFMPTLRHALHTV